MNSITNLDQHIDNYFIRNKYFKLYQSIILNSQSKYQNRNNAKDELGLVESHHYIPRSFNSSLINDKNNIAHLSFREHFIVHKLLIKCSLPKFTYKAKLAICMFSQKGNGQSRILNSIQYEYLRRLHIENTSGNNNPMFGRGGTTTNKIAITNGIDTVFIHHSDQLPTGWWHGSSIKGKHKTITNGLRNSRILNDEVIPEGWMIGSSIKGKRSKLSGRKIGEYSEERKHAIKNSLQNFLFITNGVTDKKIKINEQIPDGFFLGRTNGGSKKNETFELELNDSLLDFGFSSKEDAKIKLEKECLTNSYQHFIKKYVKRNVGNNHPSISTILKYFNLTPIKLKRGPKKK